jgi:putative Ca2+/H+ antiporter (TMEM165/GDT1 family)
MTTALLLSLGVIFVAELGDKSQLMALTFALRYRWQIVLGAIAIATAAIFGASVLVGHYLGSALPTHLVAILSGAAFMLVGLWSLRAEHDDADSSGPPPSRVSAFLAVTSAFLLAELGDKTMFTAVALASSHNGFGVWLGSTLAMVAADGLALVVGLAAGRRVPEDRIRTVAAYLFLFVGSWTLASALWRLPIAELMAAAAAVLPVIAALRWAYRHRASVVAGQRGAVELTTATDHVEQGTP